MKRASSSLLPFVLYHGRSSSVVVAAAWGGVTPLRLLPIRQSSSSPWFHADTANAGVGQNTRTQHPTSSASFCSSSSSSRLLGRRRSSPRLQHSKCRSSSRTMTRLSSTPQDTSTHSGHEMTDPVTAGNDLVEQLRRAYSEGETDGVVDFLTAPPQESSSSSFLFGDNGDVSASDWVAAAWDAAENQKGRASSILNAMMGSCVVMQTPSFAWELLHAYDALSDDDAFLVDTPITPDIVTLCLAYTALKDRRTPVVNDHNDSTTTTTTTNGDYWDRAAETILDRAQRMAKKVGGSQRRKALAAAKRKPKRTKNGNKNDDEDDDTIDLPKESELEVLAETADLVVLSKPAGMVCFHKRLTTAGKGKKGKKGGGSDLSLEHVLASCGCALSTLNADARGLVHRLDRGTSGCIVLAKSEPSHAFLVTDFFLRRNSKSYLALIPTSVHDDDDGASFVPKELQEGDSGTIELPVEGRPAKSLYRVERMYDSCFGKPMTLIRVTTVTGRKHQVRIHLAKGLGRPIFMDPLYGDHRTNNSFTDEELSERLPKDGKPRFFLHAASLELPRSGIRVEAPLPSWWTKAMN